MYSGSTGVYLTPKDIADDKARLQVKTVLRNSGEKPIEATVRQTVTIPGRTLDYAVLIEPL